MNKFATMTKQLMSKLPNWFKMRKDPESLGAQFLNVMGLEYDDIVYLLEYAYQNQFLVTADVNQVDIIYKASLPTVITAETNVTYTAPPYPLEEAPDLMTLLGGFSEEDLSYQQIFYNNPYYIDYVHNVIYVKTPYNGLIHMVVKDSSDKVILKQDLPLSLHHIWNFFDEFGMLLGVSRLYGEVNIDYKKRILDVFKHPANASEIGLGNGIARELGLIKEVLWPDGGVSIILKEPRVNRYTLEVDGLPFDQANITTDESGRIVLLGDLNYSDQVRSITYAARLSLHQLYDKTDQVLHPELFDSQGLATAKLQYFVDVITNSVPVMWDKFVWGEGFWDISNPDMSGYGVIPSFTDASISPWLNYSEV